jgi:N-acetylneuraminic acid mutarotase
MKAFILLSLLVLLTIHSNGQHWDQIQAYPDVERDDAISFTIGTKAYCGTGLKVGWVPTVDMHCLNMSNDTWSEITDLPAGNERQYAAAFSNDTLGFIVGGTRGSKFLNDVWSYDPVSDQWVNKGNAPFIGRGGSVAFCIDNVAYLIGGVDSTNQMLDEVWSYDIHTNTWTQKADFPFGGRWRASGCSFSYKGYLIFGKDAASAIHNELYSYDPVTDQWSFVKDFPLAGRTYSTLTVIDSSLIVVGGKDSIGTHNNDVWSYSINTDQWDQRTSIPSAGRKGGVAFTNGVSLYYSTGINGSNQRLNETWKATNVLSVKSNEEQNFSFFPNPCINELIITAQEHDETLRIYSILGVLMIDAKLKSESSIIDVSSLDAGSFLLQIGNKTKLFIKE